MHLNRVIRPFNITFHYNAHLSMTGEEIKVHHIVHVILLQYIFSTDFSLLVSSEYLKKVKKL